MAEDGKSLESLIEQASRARRLAVVLNGQPAGSDLEQYAEELEVEIRRRAAEPATAPGSRDQRRSGASN
jgi:hypothetical protein